MDELGHNMFRNLDGNENDRKMIDFCTEKGFAYVIFMQIIRIYI